MCPRRQPPFIVHQLHHALKLKASNHSLDLLTSFVLLSVVCLANGSLSAQTSAPSDTVQQAGWSDETYYEIEMLRLERWLRKNRDGLDSALLQEVLRMKSEAENFAEAQDYEMANIWLETIWELLTSDEIEGSDEEKQSALSLTDTGGDFDLTPQKHVRWTRQVITGMDFWRHEFNFNFLESDSTLLDGSGNPSTALRLGFDYGSDYRNSLQGYTHLKYSRDYLVGEANVRWTQPLADQSYWKLENRFEANSFSDDYGNLKYLQNESSLAFRLQEPDRIKFDLVEQFMLRRYDGESSSYSDFFDNDIRVEGKFSPALGMLLGLGLRNKLRFHPTFDLKDYVENRLRAIWLQTVGPFNFNLENDLSYRDYTNAPVDTTYQDYLENTLYGDMELTLTRSVGVQIRGTVTRRNYDGDTLNRLPDYTFWEAEPELYVKFGSDWKLSGGFYYAEQKHETKVTDARLDPNNASFSILFEDYYRYGPSITLDLFRSDGFILSVKESYLMERYPNSPSSTITDFSLFSDRNINSILLFMTWNIDLRWQINLIANIDDDRGRRNDSSDSQSTIVGLELGYSF